ncbi:MAG: tetratricopeptide repeat protein [Myxococcales bacterium]
MKRKPTQVGIGPKAPADVPPAPKKPAPPSSLQEESDLPAPFFPDELEHLPAPKKKHDSPGRDLFDDVGFADLPAPRDQAEASDFDPFADVDLPTTFERPGGTDLPAPRNGGGNADLPAPLRGRGAAGSDRSARAGAARAHAIDPLDEEDIDLPMALTDAELPRPKTESQLPDPISLDSDLPMPMQQQDLPVARDDFMDLDLDLDDEDEIEGPGRSHGGGPIELDLPDEGELELEMDLDAPAKAPSPPPPVGQARGAARISSDSEVDLTGLDDVEPSGFSSEPEEVRRMPRLGGREPTPKRKAKAKAISFERPSWLIKAAVALGVAGLVLGAGFYAGTTKYGLFGIHLIEPFLPASGDAVEATQAIESAELIASSDTYADTRRALETLRAARANASLNRALVARSLLHESYYQARYGQDNKSAAAADSLRLFLQRRGDEAPRVHVALAADALRNSDMATAKSEIQLAAMDDPTDTYVDLVSGEIALRERKAQAAIDAFARALKKHDSARAQWGLARGYRMVGDAEKAAQAAQATLALSPNHAGARVAVAKHRVNEGQLDEAYEMLRAPAGLAPVDNATLQVASSDKSAALALIAWIDESRGRMGAAREMYDKALELDSSNADAALGAARLVLLERAYQDAYARFQTVLSADIEPGASLDATGKPKVLVEAKLGAAEALLAMNKAEEAKRLLADLATPEPVNARVEIWQGKVDAALDQSESAVRHFRNAIALDPQGMGAYMALAQYYTQTKRPSEAVAVLVEAQKNVEITPEVRRLLGWAELQRNKLDEAIEQFQGALEMEPRDSSSQFGLAQAYRRKSMLDEAAEALGKVEAIDAKFPGLQLEEGRLAEARGDMEAAIASYRDALSQSPNDTALQSRLGATLVLSGQTKEGESLLRQVLETQAYSAEAEHFLGRIDLERHQLDAARAHFERASRLEPNNGLYRMYVAWTALEANEMVNALRGLDEALKLDPTLGDAYWLRARIRIRAGVVRDALADLQKALELNPSRVEAWAAMAECHYQLGQTKEAIADLQKAVQARPERGYWWYRLGRLQLDEGQRQQALTALTKATSIGDASPEPSGWLADAHRLVGDIYYAQKKRRDAVVEYGRYLELADSDAIDRADVENKLQRIGRGLD